MLRSARGDAMGLGGVMTPAGVFELPLMAVQVGISIVAAWAGIRIVDDVRHLKAVRARRAAERTNS